MTGPLFFLEIKEDASSPQISGLISPLISGERCRSVNGFVTPAVQQQQSSVMFRADIIWMISETFHCPEKPHTSRNLILYTVGQFASCFSSDVMDILLRPINHQSTKKSIEPRKKIKSSSNRAEKYGSKLQQDCQTGTSINSLSSLP